jgi:MFS family permease
MQELGLGWLIVQLAERDGAAHLVPVYLGLVGLARGVPVLFAGLAAGVIADRVDRRRLLMGVQIYWATVSAVLAWLTLAGVITIGLVLALTVLSAIAQAFDGATRQTVYPRLVPPRAMVSAIGLNSMAFNVAQFIGPMIGGFLIGPIGVGGLVTLNALSFFALIYAIFISSPLPSQKARVPVGPLRSLQESFAFVVREPAVGWPMLLSLAGNLLSRSFQPLFPAFVHDALHGDARDLSFVMTAAGMGALTGAFGTASLGSIRRRGLVFACSGMALGSMLVLFGLQRSLLPAIHTPDELRGRVMGLSTVVVQGGMSMGAMLLGSLGAVIGIGAALAVGGGLFATTTGAALLRASSLRDEPKRGDAPASASTPAAVRSPVGSLR